MYLYRIFIDNYLLMVVVSDGFYIKFLEVELVIVYFGEWFDFFIYVNGSIINYMIRGYMLECNRCIIVEVVLYYKGVEEKFVRIDFNRYKCF